MKEAVKRFQPSVEQGLNNQQVQQQIEQGLTNVQINTITKSNKEIIQHNLFNLFNLINAILAGLIIYVGSYKNLLFLGVVLSNLIIGIFQELRAKKILDKVSLINQEHMHVIREGKELSIHIKDIVLDDIMHIKNGAQICCDAILIQGRLEVNESNVNGESDIIIKQAGDFLYSGSFVVSGDAYAQVEHVGEDNYVQSILKEAKKFKKHKSQLRDSINFIIKYVGIAIIPIGLLLFYRQYIYLHYPFSTAIISTVAALIGMIPEGLVLLTSVALALGAIHLAKQKTLVQELYCIETLARVDTLCLDKTGTITQGCMKVENILSYSNEDCENILYQMLYILKDDNSTAQAIRNHVKGVLKDEVCDQIPFSSDRKYSAISFVNKGTYFLGAYDFIKPILDDSIHATIENHTKQGKRIVVLTHCKEESLQTANPTSSQILALIILSDPIRKEAYKTLDYFKEQGVSIKIISGDHPLTVQSIAKQAGVAGIEKTIDASTINDNDIPDIIEKYNIFGRVSPKQKQLFIKALKKQHTVAMMGDGVNDVMALKEADCSISVAQGSSAAKNISNLILLDNNFKHIPAIVAEGRRVINNIQRAASLFLVKTIFSFLLAVLTLFINNRYPFAPIQLTLISSLSIGIPSFFLAMEPNYDRVRGNFLFNVLSYAFPGALSIVTCVIIVSIYTSCFAYNDTIRSTMCVILTGICFILVLIRVSQPFTRQRKIICFSMFASFLGFTLFLSHIFLLYPLDQLSFIVTCLIICLIPFIMNLYYKIFKIFKKRLEKKLI